MKTNSILNDLGQKVKSVADLIRFISNTTPSIDREHNNTYPNFSLLLGSGASVTSGVRSGGQLIKDWKEEIKKETNCPDIDEYLKGCNWYDPANEYSSLFENRFDLQRQRRIFVEKEVAEKSPSIGYAYLVSLVNNGWFNTIFTTNFDDLINESFYRFSKRRPVVCAHDSSISAVTITSDRPKIIKLHGDYLFDNIKATLRETESLEINMQMKIREFAKNGGLIVIGYSGQDRSIMDILSVLVSHPDYFKNGVYWCVREGDLDSIGPELMKFLWRDRVYLVTIKGFDEVMADMNEYLNDGALPIRNELLSREHHDEIVRGLTTNTYIINSQSEILKRACKQLNDSVEENLIEDYMHYLSQKRFEKKRSFKESEPEFKTGLPNASEKERTQIQKWSAEVYIAGHRQKVVNELTAIDVFSLPDNLYKLELLGLFMEITDDLPDDKIKLYHDELIRLNPNNQGYYILAASRSERYSQKLDYYHRAMKAFPNDYYVYYKYADCMIDYKRSYLDDEDVNDTDNDIEKAIVKSIELQPSLSNEIWKCKARWLKFKYKLDNNKKVEETDRLIEEVEAKNIYHPNLLEILNICESKKLNETYFKTYIDFYMKADNVDYLERCYISNIDWLQENKKFGEVKKKIEEYEFKVKPSERFMRNKAHWYERFTLYEEALGIIDGLRNTEDDKRFKIRLLAKLGKLEDLETYYQSLKKPSEAITMEYYEGMGRYDKIVELYKLKQSQNEYLTMVDVSVYSYSLLQLEKYQDCYEFLSHYYSKPETCEAFIIVNYLMAKKLKNSKSTVDSEINKKIITSYIQYGNEVMAAAYSLINDKRNMLKHIKAELDKNPDFFYFCKTWPVLKMTLRDNDYADLEMYVRKMDIKLK